MPSPQIRSECWSGLEDWLVYRRKAALVANIGLKGRQKAVQTRKMGLGSRWVGKVGLEGRQRHEVARKERLAWNAALQGWTNVPAESNKTSPGACQVLGRNPEARPKNYSCVRLYILVGLIILRPAPPP